ncbi:chemotaxis protein CheB [Kribbella pittospori]|uniref:protein-glutamate methylesterase n=1 Tax=Kribbella pittospori TaxID=722689 RepID=A0A4V2M8G4_9ACTN|nr:chemotaxis protein CheB [Kribbella pittospori]TCC51462.1 chemotaxis protein CheB [Kribbella pittospori]
MHISAATRRSPPRWPTASHPAVIPLTAETEQRSTAERQHHRDLIVVGASAGGVEALRDLMSGLPVGLPAAVLVVLHLPAGGTSALAEILDRAGALPVRTAGHGNRIELGHVYVAPPDNHLLVEGDWSALSRGPTENGHRPAVDALFRSAALARGPRVIGVVLSGVLDDGTAGLVAIKSRGGLAMVHDPADAGYAGMPESALRTVRADHVLAAREMGAQLDAVVRKPLRSDIAPDPTPLLRYEDAVAGNRLVTAFDMDRIGRYAGLTCPECQGSLLALEPGQDRFRCPVGHAWTADALLSTADDRMQTALWTALRTLEEKARLAAQMAVSAHNRGSEHLATTYEQTAEETSHAAGVLRDRLTTQDTHHTSQSTTQTAGTGDAKTGER